MLRYVCVISIRY